MKLPVALKEIYISLPEDDAAFVCMIRYGGLIQKSCRFSLAPIVEAEVEEEDPQLVRTRRRFDPRRNVL